MEKKKQPAGEDKQVMEYKPGSREQAALQRHSERVENAPPAPRIKMVNGRWDIDHPEPKHGWRLYMEALGTTSIPFALEIQRQLNSVLSLGNEFNPDAVNFGLAVIASVKPRDELETMLAAQMAAVHAATMTQARRLALVETIPQQDSAERALNKLARTFAAQMETLKRYRTGGEQKVTVHHVTVNEGGQAIVGNVEQPKGQGEG